MYASIYVVKIGNMGNYANFYI